MAFTLRIFESEFKEIQDFVLKYPNIETGGDLFGLWQANGDPVVQLIIGPGQNCRRTSVSFHQDTNYLAKFGTFVNSSYMLCHIGSWHSHHQLSLSQPSAGDRSTVCNNFPEGLQRYIMIIANIGRGSSTRNSVVIHPYMFTEGGHVCRPGSVHKISGRSPFRDVVLSHLVQGAEHVLMDKEDYLSRVPFEYHQRPSTRSKGTSYALESVTKSHSPMKVESPKKYELPSTLSKPSHQWTESSHNRLTNDADHYSPMEVDSPRADQNQQKSQYQATESCNNRKSLQGKNHYESKTSDTNEATQWYETEKGGGKLKEIIEEITRTNMASENINYQRDLPSKNLMMEFTHYGKKWVIKFPKSFDDEPALIEDYHGKFMQSKNVVKDIRKACNCFRCRDHEHQYQHSPSDHPPSSPVRGDRSLSPSRQDRHQPSPLRRHPPSSPLKRDHPHSPPKQDRYSPYLNQPPSRRTSRSTTQPWYNSQSGKALWEKIKTDIETYVKTTRNAGKVRVTETSKFKKLIFYHDHRDWIIEFVNSPRAVHIKIDQSGKERFVAKLSSPYDVLGELNQHCFCNKCRAMKRPPTGQRRSGSTRPNSGYAYSRHITNDVCPTPSPDSPTRDQGKFFASVNGEERFSRICSDISSLLLSGKGVDMTRNIESKDIEVKFEHNHMQWKVVFPFNFPQHLPKVEFTYMYSYRQVNQFIPIRVRNDDVVQAVRKTCVCRSCKRYNPH